MSGGIGGNPFSGYAMAKLLDPKPGEAVDVQADQAALDQEELQELEAALYGEGAGPARAHDPDPAPVHRVHVPHPHLSGRHR